MNRLMHDLPMHELRLTIEPAPGGAGYQVLLQNPEEPRESLRDHAPPFDLDGPESTTLHSLRNHGSARPDDHSVEKLGRPLAELLLPPRVRARLYALIARNTEAQNPFRLWLEILAPELADVPWELAHLDPHPFVPGMAGFLGLNPRFHLVRKPLPTTAADTSPLAPLRVLIAWADPCSPLHPSLPFAVEEARSVLACIRRADHLLIEPQELPHATPDTLARALREWQPHVLHFIGHGNEQQGGTLILEGDRFGAEAALTGEALAQWIDGETLRLAVLSACRTATVARTLVRSGVGSVLAMQMPWRDRTSTAFFREFYTSLLAPGRIEAAVRDGRQVLAQSGTDWAVPALYVGRETDVLLQGVAASGRQPRPVFSNLPYLSNPDFRGRARELAELHRSLIAPNAQPVALVGLGGLGKTQLASEYAHRFRREYPGGVFWINARDTLRMKEDYAAISRYFDVPETLSVEERVQRLRMIFQELPLPALVIYDNVTQYTDLRLLPTVGNCRILATAREEYTVRAVFRLRSLTALDEAPAHELLQTGRVAQGEAERRAVCEIAALLGNLPLALALVANHIRRSLDLTGNPATRPFGNYLNRLKLGPQQVLDRARRHFTAATQHDGAVFDAIAISYRELPPETQEALHAAACFAARGIPPNLLLNACMPEDPDGFSDLLADLLDCSLVTREEDGRLSLHEVVRLFAHDQMQEPGLRDMLNRVARVLVHPLQQANESLDFGPVRDHIPHCRVTLELCRDCVATDGLCLLLVEMGIYGREMGDFADALGHLEEALHLIETHHGQRRHPLAIRALAKFGEVKQELNAPEEARECTERALRNAEQSGAESDLIILCCSSLGWVLKKQNRFEEARNHYQRALEIGERTYGRQHPRVAECLNNIAMLLLEQRELEDALGYLRETLAIYERNSGPTHVTVGIALNNIGQVLAKLGQWEQALELHQRAEAIFRAAYGNRHPDLATSLFYLANSWRELGQMAAAEPIYRETLALYIYFYGDQNYRCQVVREHLKRLNES